jgi:hypothetical protein
MVAWRQLLHQLLRRAGVQLARADPSAPEGLTPWLRRLHHASGSRLSTICLDDDSWIQRKLLGVLPEHTVWFCSPLELRQAAPPSTPTSRSILLVLGWDAPLANHQLRQLPCFGLVTDVLVRLHLGPLWRGELDLLEVQNALAAAGFALSDVISEPSPAGRGSPADSIVLSARRCPAGAPVSGSRRLEENLALLSRPLLGPRSGTVLAGRRSWGFAGGVFNPGAIDQDGSIFLLCRGEHWPWHHQKRDEAEYFRDTTPLGVEWSPAEGIREATPLRWAGSNPGPAQRAEDFRLFRFRGETLANHSVITPKVGGPRSRQALRTGNLVTRVGFSRLDRSTASLSFLGSPRLDRPLGQTEKNWAVMTAGERLFIIYSCKPFLLLELRRWDGLEFATVRHLALDSQLLPGLPGLRNSINPVDYDDHHWLHVVHHVFARKQYCFWAILIGKRTLVPEFILPRPLARGGVSFDASILYLCSAVAGAREIRFFCGVNDSGFGTATLKRSELDAAWQPIIR